RRGPVRAGSRARARRRRRRARRRRQRRPARAHRARGRPGARRDDRRLRRRAGARGEVQQRRRRPGAPRAGRDRRADRVRALLAAGRADLPAVRDRAGAPGERGRSHTRQARAGAGLCVRAITLTLLPANCELAPDSVLRMHAVTGTGRLVAGRYRLQGPVGRGAMGIVWRGRDELLHRDVAVKQVQITALTVPSRGATPRTPQPGPGGEAELAYQRTLREARTAARLSHPAVVTVFDVVEEEGSPWIIMEFIDGRSLEQVIAEDGPLPPLHAAELGTRLLDALD